MMHLAQTRDAVGFLEIHRPELWPTAINSLNIIKIIKLFRAYSSFPANNVKTYISVYLFTVSSFSIGSFIWKYFEQLCLFSAG